MSRWQFDIPEWGEMGRSIAAERIRDVYARNFLRGCDQRCGVCDRCPKHKGPTSQTMNPTHVFLMRGESATTDRLQDVVKALLFRLRLRHDPTNGP